MKTKDLIHLGVPEGDAMQGAHAFIREYIAAGNDGAILADDIFLVVADPSAYFDDALRAPLARALYRPAFTPRAELAPWRKWGDDLDPSSIKQMANACALPVALAGALMPDAHVGYGLPIGGVLATENAVVPYAGGVDIAIGMKLTVYDRKANVIPGQRDRLANILLSKERGVEQLSSGLDEVPGVYKDIHTVMAAQTDLVETLGRFDPKLVKMCPAGENQKTEEIVDRRSWIVDAQAAIHSPSMIIHPLSTISNTMSDILHKTTVLVLNRNWQAIHTKTPADAFCMMASGAATGLDVQGDESISPVRWDDWLQLPVRDEDLAIQTPRGPVRVPTVIVAANYDKVPLHRPRLGARGIWERDGGVCQYTGRKLALHEGNIDHVVPRSRGGTTSWENCVLSHRDVNSRKGDRMPQEAGLRLVRQPHVPKAVPATALIRNTHGIRDWRMFLGA